MISSGGLATSTCPADLGPCCGRRRQFPVSSHRFDLQTGVDRQLEDAEDTRTRLPWGPFAKSHRENDTLASKKRKVVINNSDRHVARMMCVMVLKSSKDTTRCVAR
ncbi:hypothetical protein [Streptomyces lydicus]|uniref:hypothetical protein n=1 Tax=Streptomyces lydicus TaxID=47763 RepID=UPI002870480D|nr:hypothetical protein [Streptomyces lydicus]